VAKFSEAGAAEWGAFVFSSSSSQEVKIFSITTRAEDG
jgi:hypothetical protein